MVPEGGGDGGEELFGAEGYVEGGRGIEAGVRGCQGGFGGAGEGVWRCDGVCEWEERGCTAGWGEGEIDEKEARAVRGWGGGVVEV